MTEEPFRWLEAIANRREYIRDQLSGGTPVFAVSRPEGIYLLGVGSGHSKVFEIYDRHGFTALGNPVDIEKIRQTAIEAAHLEGFNRSAADVTLKRLISFSLGPALKNSFEQIFSPPFILEGIFAELSGAPSEDHLVRIRYDGKYEFVPQGIAVAFTDPPREAEAVGWLKKTLADTDSPRELASTLLTAWKTLREGGAFDKVQPLTDLRPVLNERILEFALLDRRSSQKVRYRPLALAL
ncbi:MAG: hypothetical protein SFY92_04760 [Verrucomicrobiae bacterium]|nr:hypothetical protein [Verrucomicrobiae bacterium]